MDGSPVLINMHSNTAEDHLTSAADGVYFDLRATGHPQRIGWTRADAPVGFLALDRNWNGQIDDGRELFGNFTVRSDGTRARNGFEALKDFDLNDDGKIDTTDAVFSQLRLWFDRNHNGRSEPEELMSLAAVGIDAIFTAYTESPRKDRFGNSYRFVGTATIENHRKDLTRRIFDVFFVSE